jgi:Kef-type K+ transport system membrane component KefB
MRLLHRNVGQLTLAAGMIDDAVGWLLLSVVSAAVAASGGVVHAVVAMGALLGFVLVALVIGGPLVRRGMDRAVRSADHGSAVTAAVLIVLAGAVATHALGLEPIFGAFVAGALIARSRTAQVKLAPLRLIVLSVLAPLFLATVGLRVDLTLLLRPKVALVGAAVLLVAIAGKFAGAYLGARLCRIPRWEGLALGAAMNSRGVIEIIVALTGLRLGVLNPAGYTIIVLVAVVTSLMTPPLLRLFMAKVELVDEERLRKIDHDTWYDASLAGGRHG